MFYAFTDIKDASTGETTKSYGVGLNLYDVVGAELQVNDKIGIGVSANIFALNASVDVDLFGTSSVFIGLSSDASDDVSINNGFTIEVDTRFLGLVLILLIYLLKDYFASSNIITAIIGIFLIVISVVFILINIW